jgi:predicted DNA-binding transcriptional regulator YafY
MRAGRLLEILLLLQVRGRMTAGQLAERLEVSARTIQRDMDALSAAGVPVYAQRGGDGGWQLAAGFRSDLTGLTPSEVLAVVVGRPEGVLEGLGLDDPGDAALLKIIAATPELARHAAEHARQRLHVDLLPWDDRGDSAVLPALREAAAHDRIVRITYGGRETAFPVAPLGLVCKGVVWYLVALRGTEHRTYRVSRIHDVELTDETFDRPAGFDLPSHWREVRTNVRQTFPSFPVRLRVELADADDAGWQRADADLETEHEAVSVVLSLGGDAIVDRPSSLRRAVAREATAAAANNS